MVETAECAVVAGESVLAATGGVAKAADSPAFMNHTARCVGDRTRSI